MDAEETLKTKKQKTPIKDKKSIGEGLADIRRELKKVIWPDKVTLMKKTSIVIFTSCFIGVIIILINFIFSMGFDAFWDLLNRV